MPTSTTLIDTNSLARDLGRADLVIFDCRSELGNPRWGEEQFASSHLPGAQFLHLERDLSGPIEATTGRHPLPDPLLAAEMFAARGVGEGCQVVAYDQGNGAYAARAWWLLRWLGFQDVAVLDGGLAAWRAAGLPLTQATIEPEPRRFRLKVDRNALVDAALVEHARRRPGNLLIDARGADRFAGRNETIDPIAGHVPGARSFPFAGNLAPDGKFLARDALRRRFDSLLGSLPPSALISMCGSGVTACHNLLALEHAGLPGARLYGGSWSEWIRDATRPIETGSY
jgi:thiosulfate/3-mercaptopyruvate sulfurtransferase